MNYAYKNLLISLLQDHVLKVMLQFFQHTPLLTLADTNSVFLHYTLVQVHTLTTTDKLHVYAQVPLKSANHYFEIYRALLYTSHKVMNESLSSKVLFHRK